MSYAPEIFIAGKWTPNGLIFATKAEAHDYAADVAYRWFAASGWRGAVIDEPVNARFVDGKLERLK